MTNQTTFTRPAVSAVALFQRIAPTFATEIAAQMHRAGLRNSDDLICALTTGLRSFARDQGVCLATDFPKAWPEALQALRPVRSEQEWEELLAQSTAAPQAKGHLLALGASQMIKILEGAQQTAGMSPRIAVALGSWVMTAIIIAHSGPLDADLSLEQLADCL
ncbi:MAG: hypothetical protein ACKVLA_16445 [Rhodobacterales bacterium]